MAWSDRIGVSKRVTKPAKALYQTIASSPLYFEPQAPKKLHKKKILEMLYKHTFTWEWYIRRANVDINQKAE